MLTSYFIYGTQNFEIEKEANAVREKIIHQYKPEQYRFSANDFLEGDQAFEQKNITYLQNAINCYSFLSEIKFIEINHIQRLSASGASTKNAEEKIKSIFLYLPQDQTSEILSEDPPKKESQKISLAALVSIIRVDKKKMVLALMKNSENKQVKTKSGILPLQDYILSYISEARFEEKEASAQKDSQIIALIKNALESENENVYFLFTALIKTPRELKGELGKVLEKKCQVIKTIITYDDFSPVNWLINLAKNRSLMMEPNTARLIIEICGNNLQQLDMEMTKIYTLPEVLSAKEISKEIIRKSVSHSKSFEAFWIIKYLSQKNLTRSLEYLDFMSSSGNHSETISILGMITAHFRRLLRVEVMQHESVPFPEIESRLKISSWLLKEQIKVLNNYTLEELENIYLYLSRLDLRIKYSGKDGVLLLKDLCFMIVQGYFQKQNTLTLYSPPY